MVNLNQCHVYDQQLTQSFVMIAKKLDTTDFRINNFLHTNLGAYKIFNSVMLLICHNFRSTDSSIERIVRISETKDDMKHLGIADFTVGKAKVLRVLKATNTLKLLNIIVNEQVEAVLFIANNVKLELIGWGLAEKKFGNALDSHDSHESLSYIKLL